jgi:coenzyme F420-reducing hydrogenase beta subunit
MPEIEMESPRFNYEPRIMHSSDEKTRLAASSGGVVSSLMDYLFKSGFIKSALAFDFDRFTYFSPKLIFKYDDYRPVGSIYHDIELAKYVKDNLGMIQGPILITCRPCEVRAMRAILSGGKIDSFIISLTCSAQMTKEATDYLLGREGIDRDKLVSLQYRGNGWPSGVQIVTPERKLFFPNNNFIWFHIFHSHIFTLKKCFSCQDTFGLSADLTVADPWLKRYIDSEKLGNTIVLTHSQKGYDAIAGAISAGYLKIEETISGEEALLSQLGTLRKKYIFRKSKILRKVILPLIRSGPYRIIWKKIDFMPRLHYKLINGFIRFMTGFQNMARQENKS